MQSFAIVSHLIRNLSSQLTLASASALFCAISSSLLRSALRGTGSGDGLDGEVEGGDVDGEGVIDLKAG